eukprot:TRINITY_DN70702_c0_g1_i1.p1 TRINITY_DN70702_c0_g1~~TRINITY_DN70702_c0_g1_i1.p1  ORF type:complete len:229 (-),score=33.13 TRINITY_DN70702_c0_g1_i1:11-697(-)
MCAHRFNTIAVAVLQFGGFPFLAQTVNASRLHDLFSVKDVEASDLILKDYDAIIDVRNLDEYKGMTPAKNCSVGSFDPKGCLYGHIRGALWLPQFNLCGGTTPGVECTDRKQYAADVKEITGHAPTSESVWPRLLEPCLHLRLAFVCHSGVRSLAAATKYVGLLNEAFEQAPPSGSYASEVVSVSTGTQGWYLSGRPTVFGPNPGRRKLAMPQMIKKTRMAIAECLGV